MDELDSFEVCKIPGDSPRSELRWQGVPTGLTVDGIVLEKQYGLDCGGRYLLFLTEDSPFEEGLHIYLLDQERRRLDAIELGAPYTPAMLQDVEPDGPRGLQFSFFGQDRWRLEVQSAPRWRFHIGWLSPWKFKQRPMGCHWLLLRRRPSPNVRPNRRIP